MVLFQVKRKRVALVLLSFTFSVFLASAFPPSNLFACQAKDINPCSLDSNYGISGSYNLQNNPLALTIKLDRGLLKQVQLFDSSSLKLIANGASIEEGPGPFNFTLLQPGTGQKIELGAANVRFSSVEGTGLQPTSGANSSEKSNREGLPPATSFITLRGEANWQGSQIKVNITFSFLPEGDFIQTRASLDPFAPGEGWVVSNAQIARWKVDPSLAAVPKNPLLDSALYFQKRWRLPEGSTPGNWLTAPDGRGVYLFTNSPFGREYYQAGNLYITDQYDHQALTEGFESGPAVFGYFKSGGSEMGYTRFVSYLTQFVSRMTRGNKRAPVFFNTWIPNTNRIDEGVISKSLDFTRQAGYYDVLHVDAGWEGTEPLQVDKTKFPGGLDLVQQKAQEQNLGLGLWINPYSDSYFGYVNYETTHRNDRDWHVVLTEGYLPKQGFNRGAFQVLSPYSDYVEERLVDLVNRYDLRMIYWDGADWNIRDSEVDFLDNDARQRLKVLGIKRLMRITEKIYAIRPNLQIVGWNAWVDPHLLSVFDQQQVTDIYTAPLGIAETSRRRIYYGMSYIMPFGTIWSDWYGLTYNERKDNQNLRLPESQLEYAELSMLSKGLKEAGGTVDTSTRPDLRAFLKNLFAFHKRFDKYFDIYQRLTDAPDPNRPDASGHIIDGKGFVIANNPTILYQQINISFNPTILGFQKNKTYNVYEWTQLKQASNWGKLAFSADGKPTVLTITLAPQSVRILGVDMDNNSGEKSIPAQAQSGN